MSTRERKSTAPCFRRSLRPALQGLCAAVLAIVFLSQAPAECAAGPAGGYGAHAAYTKAGDARHGNWMVGGQLELPLGPMVGLQGSVDYRASAPYAASAVVGDAVTVKSIPFTLTGRIYLPTPSSLSPFLLAGAGWYRVFYDYSPELENQFGFDDTWVSTFGWHFGAGASLALAPPLSVYGEGRYVFVDPKRKLSDDVQERLRNLDYNSIYIGAGVSMGF